MMARLISTIVDAATVRGASQGRWPNENPAGLFTMGQPRHLINQRKRKSAPLKFARRQESGLKRNGDA